MATLSPALSHLFDEAQDLHQAGRLADAKTRYEHILATEPHHGPTLHMVGLMAFQVGQADVAVDLLTRAARLDAGSAALHSNLGLALRAVGKLQDAADAHARAVILAPGWAATHTNLGDTLAALGRLEQAQAAHKKALALDPGDAQTLKSLALLAQARGDALGALAYILAALRGDDSAATHRAFAGIVQTLRWQEDDADARAGMTRAITEGWGRPAALAVPAQDLIRHHRGALQDDALLLALLAATPVTDVALERELTEARRTLLLRGGGQDDFAAALARQCFINEYVWARDAEEDAEVARLSANARALSDAQAIALACYLPLGSLPDADALRADGPALAALLAQQRDEPAEEARLAAALPRLTPVEDDVSRAVRAQYEENPYPRWTRLPQALPPLAVTAYLHERFGFAGQLPQAPTMLAAGCGTGQYALELARKFTHDDMLAVDLSRASLGHAARKAAESGIASVRFAQADILRLGAMDRRFDIIECSGVLHHMRDPFAGWRALLDCLNPGGVMLTAFYSTIAREPIARTRDWIAREGFAATPEGIRACRQRLMAEPERLGAFAAAGDFFSTSDCRDLLFHVQERTVTLDEIAVFLRTHGLAFLGFEAQAQVLENYRARFPIDPAARDLGNWAMFEAENPNTFAAMYQFWVHKPLS